MTLTCKR